MCVKRHANIAAKRVASDADVDTRRYTQRETPTGLHCILQTAMDLLKRHVFCQTMRISDEKSHSEAILYEMSCVLSVKSMSLSYGVATIRRSLLQNIVSFIGLFCKRDLQF